VAAPQQGSTHDIPRRDVDHWSGLEAAVVVAPDALRAALRATGPILLNFSWPREMQLADLAYGKLQQLT